MPGVSMKRMFDKVDYGPHAAQTDIHLARRDSRFRVVCAGRRTGKSTLGGHELTVEAFSAYHRRNELDPHGKRSEFWIVGPEYSDAEKEFRVLWNDLKKLEVPFDRPGTYNDPLGGNMHVSLWGGRFQVHGKSAKYPDSLVGEALEGCILAEAAKLRPIIWPKFIRPMLADYHGWGLMTSTPEGRNWFYEAWNRGQLEEDKRWWSRRMPSWANDILFPGGRLDPEILDMASDMTEEKFNQEIGAEFSEFVGRVFKDFDEETTMGRFGYNERWPLYVAADYGWTNPNVLLFIQVDIWDNVVVVDEYYKSQRTMPEVIEDVREHPRLGPLMQKATRLYPDPEDPASTRMLSDAFNLHVMGGTGGLIKERVDLIRKWLRAQPLELPDGHPDKKSKLRFSRRCINSAREMSAYRYPETKSELQNEKENPMKKDDHVPEALGRFFRGYYGQRELRGTARVSKARVG